MEGVTLVAADGGSWVVATDYVDSRCTTPATKYPEASRHGEKERKERRRGGEAQSEEIDAL